MIELKEDTFLWHWMEFCEALYPKITKKNSIAFLTVGCSLLSQAAKLYVDRTRPFPSNFFITLTGPPSSGKGRIIDCLRLVLSGTWIDDIPTGSAEGIEQEIQVRNYGFLIWDEMGELAEKQQSYLDKVKYLLNKAYYLDRITRTKTSKSSVDIPANSYYLSVILAGLPEDWKKLEKKFLGGFERRFLPVEVKRAKKPFERDEPDKEAQQHLEWLWEFINDMKNKIFIVKEFDFSALQDKVMSYDEKYWTMIEEYTHKYASVLYLNDFIEKSFSIITSQHQTTEFYSMMFNDVNDVYMMLDDAMMFNLRGESSNFLTSQNLMMLIDALMLTIKGYRNVADDVIYRILDSMENYIKTTGEVVMRKTRFAENVLGITNAQYFSYVLRALREAGKIREVEISPRRKYVVLDPTAKICYNCKHFNKVCTLDYPDAESRKYLADQWDAVEDAKECDNFEVI